MHPHVRTAVEAGNRNHTANDVSLHLPTFQVNKYNTVGKRNTHYAISLSTWDPAAVGRPGQSLVTKVLRRHILQTC
jgi:hypothetical protein